MGKYKFKVNRKVIEQRQMTLFPDVSPEVTYRNVEDDMYHCCRWCKHFVDGVCTEIEIHNDNSVSYFIESGELREVVMESFNDPSFLRFQDFLKANTRIKEKMIHEAMYRIHTDLDKAKDKWINDIIDNIFIFFSNNDNSNKYFTPPDANTFYCNRWE